MESLLFGCPNVSYLNVLSAGQQNGSGQMNPGQREPTPRLTNGTRADQAGREGTTQKVVAGKIQAVERGKAERRAVRERAKGEALETKVLDEAAVKIQARARGKAERRAVREHAKKEARETKVQDEAAVKIQALARDKAERNEFSAPVDGSANPIRPSIVARVAELSLFEDRLDLGAVRERAKEEALETKVQDEAAVKIQARARGKAERRAVRERQEKVIR